MKNFEAIFGGSLRSAILQGLQRHAVIADMNVLLTQEVREYVGLEKEEVDSMVITVKESSRQIWDFRIKAELDLLLSETSQIPKDFQGKLAELIEGVWH